MPTEPQHCPTFRKSRGTTHPGPAAAAPARFLQSPHGRRARACPADGARDVPDVALTASFWHDAYLVIFNGVVGGGGGTSASAPAFAGMMVLLNHYLLANGAQSQPGLGNLNPMLYRLAQTSPTAFHDITAGSNMVPCAIGTPNCTTGSMGYSAGPGFDLVTGLGSVDMANLAAAALALSKSTPPPALVPGTVANGATYFAAGAGIVGAGKRLQPFQRGAGLDDLRFRWARKRLAHNLERDIGDSERGARGGILRVAGSGYFPGPFRRFRNRLRTGPPQRSRQQRRHGYGHNQCAGHLSGGVVRDQLRCWSVFGRQDRGRSRHGFGVSGGSPRRCGPTVCHWPCPLTGGHAGGRPKR